MNTTFRGKWICGKDTTQPRLPWETLDAAYLPHGMCVGPGVIRLTLPTGTTHKEKDRIRKDLLVRFVNDFPDREPISIRFPDGRWGDYRYIDLENPNADLPQAQLAQHVIRNWTVLGQKFSDTHFFLGSDLPAHYIVLDVHNVPSAAKNEVAHHLQEAIDATFPHHAADLAHPAVVIDVWEAQEKITDHVWTFANRLRALLDVQGATATSAAEHWPGWIHWKSHPALFELAYGNRFDYCRLCRQQRQGLGCRHTTAECRYFPCASCHGHGHNIRTCPRNKRAPRSPSHPPAMPAPLPRTPPPPAPSTVPEEADMTAMETDYEDLKAAPAGPAAAAPTFSQTLIDAYPVDDDDDDIVSAASDPSFPAAHPHDLPQGAAPSQGRTARSPPKPYSKEKSRNQQPTLAHFLQPK